ncbi:MAG: IS200/IS605 family transposase [Balneolaceae bacterium]
MPQSLSRVYTHIIFSTKDRRNLIDDAIQNNLFDYLGGICKGLECNPVQVGGYRNHVHILCTLSRKITQMSLLEELKKQSSKWIKTRNRKYADFYWQRGYGIFSVNPAETGVVIEYIKNQEEHHRTKTFKEEYRAFLKKYNVDYDERYVWD